MITCLFCNNGNSFKTKEHIIPESLGNNDMILEKEVCDKCQNHLSKIENYVLNNTPVGFWRVLLTIKTKRGKLPTVNFVKGSKSKGAFPDNHENHDDVKFISHQDNTTELQFLNSQYNKLNNKIKYAITPKVLHELGRFLGKIGIEIICYADRQEARLEQFNKLRKYIREGSQKDLWPIFYTTEGKIQDLFSYTENKGEIYETAIYYSYQVMQVDIYKFLNFKVGVDSWFICLNEQFPHPSVSKVLGDNVSAIWYPKT